MSTTTAPRFAGIDEDRHGVVLLDQSGRVVGSNAAAQHISARGDALQLGSRLHALRQSDDAALDAALTQARTRRAKGIARIPRSNGRPDYVVIASASHAPADGSPDVSVTIVDPDAQPRPCPQILAGTFGLTTSEAHVLARLILGDTLEDAARRLGTAVTTARFHLASLFRKTGTRRQSDLLRTVLLLPPETGWDVRSPSSSGTEEYRVNPAFATASALADEATPRLRSAGTVLVVRA